MHAPSQAITDSVKKPLTPEAAERRADFFIRMLQGTMALEAQALSREALERLKRESVQRLLAR